MAIDSDYAPQSDAGNGVTTSFTIAFPFFDKTHINVQLLEAVSGEPLSPAPVLNGGDAYDYAITGVADADTGEFPNGTIVFNTAPPNTRTVWRGRNTPLTQGTLLSSRGPFPAKTVEATHDKRAMVTQEQALRQSHSLRTQDFDSALAPIPAKVARQNGGAGAVLVTDPTTGDVGLSSVTKKQLESNVVGVDIIEALVESATSAAQAATQATLQPRVTWTGYSNEPADAGSNTAKLNALIAAMAQIGVVVCLPTNAGAIPCNGQITVPHRGGIICEAPGTAWLDFRPATDGDAFPNDACVYAGGSFTALPALSADLATSGFRYADLTAAPDLAEDDYVFLVDKAALFNGVRSYYYVGDAVRVHDVDGMRVNFQTSLYDFYTAAGAKVSRMNPVTVTLSGFGIVGPGDAIAGIAGWKIYAGRKCLAEGVTSDNCSYAAAALFDCVECVVRDCDNKKLLPDGGAGLSYGLVFANCARCDVDGGRFVATRHAVTMGGSDDDQAIVNRFITVSNSILAHNAQGDIAIAAADMHGNTQFCGYRNCNIDGGVEWGGDQNFITGGTIRSGNFFAGCEICVMGTEMLSPNHIFTPDIIDVRSFNSSNRDYGIVFTLGQSGDSPEAHMTLDGTLIFKPKSLNYRFEGVLDGHQAICAIKNNGSNAKIRLEIGGDWRLGAMAGDYVVCTVSKNSGANFDLVDISDMRGNMAWDIRNTDKVILDDADLSHVGLNSDTFAPPFGTGAAISIDGATTVSAIGMKLRGGRGIGLLITNTTEVDVTGLMATGYSDVALKLQNVTRAKVAPGDLGALGITLTNCGSVKHTPGPNDGAVTLSDATTRGGYQKSVFLSPPVQLDYGGVDTAGLVANAFNKMNFSHVASSYGVGWDAANHKFQPTIAGRYRFTLKVAATSAGSAASCNANIYKNGANVASGAWLTGLTNATDTGSICVWECDMDGNADYVEFYSYLPAGVTKIYGSVFNTYAFIERVY